MKEQWIRKSNVINKEEHDPSETFEQRAGIFAEFAKVIVIGLGFISYLDGKQQLRVTAISGDDEKVILQEFKTLIEKKFDQYSTILVAHNGKEFDFPFLARRMLINGIQLPEILNMSGKKPWEIKHMDTMEMWKFGDWKSYTSLDLLASVFDIESSKSDIDGSKVAEYYYQKNDLESITKYCMKDVAVCAQVFLKLKGEKTIASDHIKYLS